MDTGSMPRSAIEDAFWLIREIGLGNTSALDRLPSVLSEVAFNAQVKLAMEPLAMAVEVLDSGADSRWQNLTTEEAARILSDMATECLLVDEELQILAQLSARIAAGDEDAKYDMIAYHISSMHHATQFSRDKITQTDDSVAGLGGVKPEQSSTEQLAQRMSAGSLQPLPEQDCCPTCGATKRTTLGNAQHSIALEGLTWAESEISFRFEPANPDGSEPSPSPSPSGTAVATAGAVDLDAASPLSSSSTMKGTSFAPMGIDIVAARNMTDPSVNTGKVFKQLVAEDKVNAYRIDTLRVVQKTLRKIVVNIAAKFTGEEPEGNATGSSEESPLRRRSAAQVASELNSTARGLLKTNWIVLTTKQLEVQVLQYHLQNYGLRNVGMQALGSFIHSIRSLARDSEKAILFGRLLHALDLPEFSSACLGLYTNVLVYVRRASRQKPRDESDEKVLFEDQQGNLMVARWLLLEAIKECCDVVHPKDVMVAELLRILATNELPFGHWSNRPSGHVDFDDTLSVCLHVVEAIEARERAILYSVFMNADANDDHLLSMSEMNKMLSELLKVPPQQRSLKNVRTLQAPWKCHAL
jgi:hypothetical protein